jgi:hypothetical protein
VHTYADNSIISTFLCRVRSRRRLRNHDEHTSAELGKCNEGKSVSDAINKLLPAVKYRTWNELRAEKCQPEHKGTCPNCNENLSEKHDPIAVASDPWAPPCVHSTARPATFEPNQCHHAASCAEGDRSICSICIDGFHDEDYIRVLPCEHIFHPLCIDAWFSTLRLWCPLCKAEIPTSTSQTNESAGQPTFPPAALIRD